MRDNFSLTVKRTIAQRVAYRCSNPKCQRLTTGPQIDDSKALNLGVCSHITAASPGGPRYNPDISVNVRKSASNAMWLCQFCAKLIDNDELKYPEVELRRWKTLSEDKARKEVEGFLKELERGAKGTIWVWDKKRNTYRNQQTGEIVGPRKIIDIRDSYLQNVKAALDESVDKLFDRKLFIQDWQLEFRSELKSTYLNCFMLAIGGVNNLTDPILQEIGIILKNEFQLLDNFALDIAEGKYDHNDTFWEKEQAKLRARSFIDTAQQAVKWP